MKLHFLQKMAGCPAFAVPVQKAILNCISPMKEPFRIQEAAGSSSPEWHYSAPQVPCKRLFSNPDICERPLDQLSPFFNNSRRVFKGIADLFPDTSTISPGLSTPAMIRLFLLNLH